MKNNALFLLLSVCLIVLSCTSKKERPATLMAMFTEEKSIKHQIIQEDVLNVPVELIYYDNKLIIVDFYGDQYFSVFDLTQNKKTATFLSKGQGPNETTDIPSSVFVTNDTTLIWYDASRCIREAIFAGTFGNVKQIRKVCDLNNPMPILRIAPLKGNKYVSVGLFDKGRYGIFDKAGNPITFKYDYPKDKVDCLPMAKAMAYQGRFLTNSNHSKIVCYTLESELLEFIKINEAGDFEKIKEIQYDLAKYTPIGPMVVVDKAKLCFIGGCSSEKFIYLLYSDEDFSKVKWFANSKTVLVFDWKGNPIKKIDLDLRVTAIAVDDKDKKLFAATNNPEGTLVSFKL